ncbi:MAG TPA: mechanosensitive ion channel domain-containing protein [Bacteriovoracaceae bacterium]|nr:mechanosensitive ion channel domain-containing protein [Bacteriovoracaceae bacterium]
MLDGLNEFMHTAALLWKHKLFVVAGTKINLGNVMTALILLFLSPRLSRWVSSTIGKKLLVPMVQDKSSQNAYQTLTFYGCLGLFISLSFTMAGIPLTVFTFLGGALAIGVGFGSQNIVNNFISGVILLVEKPIKPGDIVELDNIAGKILIIGTRSTKIRNTEGKIFVVPNSFFLEKSVLNWSFSSTTVRTVIKFGVAHGTDVKLVENVCLDILLNSEDVEQTPIPEVLLENFGDNNLEFELVFWCNTEKVESLGKARSLIRYKIDKKFKDHHIQMAFPQRDMNLKLGKTLDVRVLPNS